MATDKPGPEPENPRYRPTDRELAAMRKCVDQADAQPAPRLRVTKNGGGTTIELDHPDKDVAMALLAEALGTTDLDFAAGLLRQIVDAVASDRPLDEAKLNFVLAVVKGVKPRDELEAMLATQMAAVHSAIMTLAGRLAQVAGAPNSGPERDSISSAFNKCARTFASQLEALKRHRAGGEQKVTLQHVSVNEGGQAIVGNVSQAARARRKPQRIRQRRSATPGDRR